jgi:hypothetical protein
MQTVVEMRLAWLFRGLAVAFGVTGATFFLFPDGTIDVLNGAGSIFGLPEAPMMAHRFWLSLGSSYMAVVTALAWLIAADPLGRRPMMIALAVGKATSSLTCLYYFLAYDKFFVYLANFLVDGSLVAIALGAWLIAGKESGRGGGNGLSVGDAVRPQKGGGDSGLSATQRNRLAALIEALVPVGPAGGPEAQRLAADLERFFRGLDANGLVGLRLLIGFLNWAPVLTLRHLRTATAMRPHEREHFLGGLEKSRVLFLRAPLHALKMLVMMHYYQGDEAQRAVGMDPRYLQEKLAFAEEQRRLGAKPALPEPVSASKAVWTA